MQKMIQAISLDGYIWIWHLIIFIVVIGWLGISDAMSGHTFFNMENSIMSGLLILMLAVYGIVMHLKVVKPFKKINQVLSARKKGVIVPLYNDQELINQDVRQIYFEIDQLLNGLEKYDKSVRRNFDILHNQSDQLAATLQENQAAHGEISGAINRTAELTENQLSNVQDMRSHIERVHQSIQSADEHMRILSQLSTHCEQVVTNGVVISNQTENKIREIIRQIKGSEQASLDMSIQFSALNEVVTVIDDIARQIKLLSLNASIEAEHAGASGRGFGVVAQEINKLAKDTTESVATITESVAAMNTSIHLNTESSQSVLKIAQEGIDAVNANTSVFETVEQSVGDVLARIKKVNEEVSNISREFDQSVASSAQLGGMATHIFKETETVSAAAEEQNASMNEIAQSADVLVKISEEFGQLLTSKSY
ncbi:MAG: methyl-accepting chemotaxis protein [Sporolactobacillus sp.]